MVEVAPHLLRRLHFRGHLAQPKLIDRLKQPHLKVVGQLHLVRHPVPRPALAEQSMILERRADLAGDGGQQLAVPGREGAASPAPEQVDDTDRARLPRLRRVLDGHQKGRFGAQVGGGRRMPAVAAGADDRLPLPEHPRGEHFPRGIKRPVQSGDSFGRDLVQQSVPGIVDPQRPAARSQNVAYLVEDDPCGLSQLQDRTQDLADRIEQVDLLVAGGQLAAEEADFLFRIQDPDQLRADEIGGRRQGRIRRTDLKLQATALAGAQSPRQGVVLLAGRQVGPGFLRIHAATGDQIAHAQPPREAPGKLVQRCAGRLRQPKRAGLAHSRRT